MTERGGAYSIATALAAAVLLAGCGGDDGGDDATVPTAAEPTKPTADEKPLVAHLSLDHLDPVGWRHPASGCEVETLLLSADQVKLAAQFGDAVATNPNGTAGVIVNSPECQRKLTEALADFPD